MIGNKDIMATNIKYYMEKLDIDRNKLCSDLNLKYMTVSDWINAKTYPRIDKIEMLAQYFGINKSDLVENFQDSTILTNIHEVSSELKAQTQNRVLNYAKEQLKMQRDIPSKISVIHENKRNYNIKNKKIPIALIGTTGNIIGKTLLDEVNNDTVNFDKNEVDDYLIETADFCVYVNNDSCEPAIKSETYAFVRRTNEIRNGLIALVIYNETLLIKRIEILGDEINLISLNPKYETIKVEPHNQFKLIGKIVQ